jgi:hypothetical protein
MKWFVLIVGIAFAVGCQRQPQPRSPAPMDQHANSLAADHPAEHGSHSVHSESAPTLAFVKDAGWDKLAPTVSTPLTFHLEQAGKPVKSLELLHEKLMHLIVVRNDLGEFQHLHPVISNCRPPGIIGSISTLSLGVVLNRLQEMSCTWLVTLRRRRNWR